MAEAPDDRGQTVIGNILLATGKTAFVISGGVGGHHWAIMVDDIVYDISKFFTIEMLAWLKYNCNRRSEWKIREKNIF